MRLRGISRRSFVAPALAAVLTAALGGCSPYGYGFRWSRCTWFCPPQRGAYPILVYRDGGLGPAPPAKEVSAPLDAPESPSVEPLPGAEPPAAAPATPSVAPLPPIAPMPSVDTTPGGAAAEKMSETLFAAPK